MEPSAIDWHTNYFCIGVFWAFLFALNLMEREKKMLLVFNATLEYEETFFDTVKPQQSAHSQPICPDSDFLKQQIIGSEVCYYVCMQPFTTESSGVQGVRSGRV